MGAKTWTADMKQYLEESWGKVSMATLVKKLGKTEIAIELKADRLGLGGSYTTGEYLTANQVAKILNIDNHTITDYWIPKCNLKAKKRAIKKKEVYQIDLEVLVKWLKDNTDKWNASKVELYALGAEPEWLQMKRKKDIKTPNRDGKIWTKEEEHLLISYYNMGLSYKKIGIRMSRLKGGIERKIDRLKASGELPKKRVLIPWTKEEDKIIFKMDAENKSDEDIAWKLGREKIHVQYRRSVLIEKGEYPAESKADLIIKGRVKEILKLKNKGLQYKEIAKKLNVHPTTISRNLNALEG